MKLEGFTLATNVKPKKRRLILLAYAEAKCGKSHFSLTAPGPIAYFAMEPGLEGVIEKFADKEVFLAGIPDKANNGLPTYSFAKPAAKLADKNNPDYLDQVRKLAGPVFEKFLADWAMVLKSDVRTIVLDTASQAFDLGRFAYVGMAGKTTASQDPFGSKSGAVKAIMRGLIADCYNFDKNVVLTARSKEKWANSEPTGEHEPDGWSGCPYEVQVVMRLTKKTWKNKTVRRGIITDSRIDGDEVNGLIFGDGEECSGPLDFVSVASVITNTKPTDWA